MLQGALRSDSFHRPLHHWWGSNLGKEHSEWTTGSRKFNPKIRWDYSIFNVYQIWMGEAQVSAQQRGCIGLRRCKTLESAHALSLARSLAHSLTHSLTQMKETQNKTHGVSTSGISHGLYIIRSVSRTWASILGGNPFSEMGLLNMKAHMSIYNLREFVKLP